MKLSAHPTEKLRSASNRRSTIGRAHDSVRRTNATPHVSASRNRPSTIPDAQPCLGASFSPISSAANAAATSMSEARSRCRASSNLGSERGNTRKPTATATMPGTTLIKKSHCQLYVEVIHPPAIGPTVGARTASTPAMVVASAWPRPGKRRKPAENTIGIRTPPANPWTTRAVTSDAKPVLEAQPTDAITKTVVKITNRPRRESTRVSQPVSGIATTSAIR